MPPYTTRSSGRSATSGSRLFISMRSGASVSQLRAESSVPRGARTMRVMPNASAKLEWRVLRGETKMKWFAVVFAAAVAFAAQAQEKVVLGMSGWTGFQPLKLAELAGIFKKNGVDMEIRFIAPVQRSAALASGALNAAATTVDQHIVWSSAGIPSVQVALIDKSNGGDGLVVRNNINSIKELKGKSVNVDGPGTVQHF